ncbi:hypothetical protein NPIL_584231, partial [Nephila pilipes]
MWLNFPQFANKKRYNIHPNYNYAVYFLTASGRCVKALRHLKRAAGQDKCYYYKKAAVCKGFVLKQRHGKQARCASQLCAAAEAARSWAQWQRAVCVSAGCAAVLAAYGSRKQAGFGLLYQLAFAELCWPKMKLYVKGVRPGRYCCATYLLVAAAIGGYGGAKTVPQWKATVPARNVCNDGICHHWRRWAKTQCRARHFFRKRDEKGEDFSAAVACASRYKCYFGLCAFSASRFGGAATGSNEQIFAAAEFLKRWQQWPAFSKCSSNAMQ